MSIKKKLMVLLLCTLSTPAWAAVLKQLPGCDGYSMTLRSEGFNKNNKIYYMMEATSPDNPDRYAAIAVGAAEIVSTRNGLCQVIAEAKQKHKS